jgi:hypothetical protein
VAAAVAEASRPAAEVVVAIGLALHQFFEEQERARELAVLERPRYSGWTASGRLEIMAARERLQWRK